MLSDRCSVEVVTDAAAFCRLEPEWNDAVERAGIRHPFLRHEWLRTWWECFGAGRDLHVTRTEPSSGRTSGDRCGFGLPPLT